MQTPQYKRILLKISGEALAGDKHFGLDFDVIGNVCDVVKQCVDMGVQVGIVRLRAVHQLEKGSVVIFGCGTGNPYFSTDTAAVLRAAEINADVIMLAKNVDGVYDSDPVQNPDAKKYDQISYDDILAQHLSVMDSTATSLSMDNKIPVLLFALEDPQNIIRAICGENVGTIVKED